MEKIRTQAIAGVAFILLIGALTMMGSRTGTAQQTGGLPDVEKRVAALEQKVADLQTSNGSQAAQIAALKSALDQETADRKAADAALQTALDTETSRAERAEAALQDRANVLDQKTQFVSVDSSGEMFIRGTNLHIENGLGATNGNPDSQFELDPANTQVNGLGNLIIGYNEAAFLGGDRREGSHNLIIGPFHDYSSFGGLVAGRANAISGPHASIGGGIQNLASGIGSSVCGGVLNRASGHASSVSGGTRNTASGPTSFVSGGELCSATGESSSVSGGVANFALGRFSSVSGGNFNHARGDAATVSGGQNIEQVADDGWSAGSVGTIISGSFRSP